MEENSHYIKPREAIPLTGFLRYVGRTNKLEDALYELLPEKAEEFCRFTDIKFSRLVLLAAYHLALFSYTVNKGLEAIK